MHHVCLIQSISALKATHIKLGTRSGSSQCQLHFGTKVVSIGWSGCEWLPSECKNAHFQAFPPLAPSGNAPLLPSKQAHTLSPLGANFQPPFFCFDGYGLTLNLSEDKKLKKFGPKPAFLHPYHLRARKWHIQPPTLTLYPNSLVFLQKCYIYA